MKTHVRRTRWAMGLMMAGLAAGGVLEVPVVEDLALVVPGYAGKVEAQYGTSRRVARRTSRRTSRRHAYAYGGAGVYAGAAVAAVPYGVRYVTALPAGCATAVVGGVSYQRCGSAMYRPYYQGDTLVYVQEAPEAGPEEAPEVEPGP